jgi:hypothetical protein
MGCETHPWLLKAVSFNKEENSTDPVQFAVESSVTQFKLLELLLNATKKRIFDPTLKKFAAFIYLRGGRRNYSTPCANLPLPKKPTICKFIQQSGPRVKEGLVRVQELEVFLQTRQLPKFIWLSEDGTRITPRVQYDQTHGEIVGLSIPTAENGLPVVSYFKVESVRQMKGFMEKFQTPINLYVIMATPSNHPISAFACLAQKTNLLARQL